VKAVVKTARGPGNVSLEEMPEPECAPGLVKLEVGACGICDTDLHAGNLAIMTASARQVGQVFAGRLLAAALPVAP
jgi:D-arabinose 1-dehydrogenase-like Zn-dependent alcohol dehydrogenase